MTRLSPEPAALQRKTIEAEAHLTELDDQQREAEGEAEAAELETELLYARQLTANDEALKAAPKSVAELLLVRAAKCCRLKNIDPPVEVPDFISPKYSIYAYAGILWGHPRGWPQSGLARYDGDA